MSIRFRKNDLANTEVFDHVENYLKRNLPEYELMLVVYASDFRTDDYLYMVEAKRKKPDKYGRGDYACWTCWNEEMQCLNFGHYDLENEEEVNQIISEFYRYGKEDWETLKKVKNGDRIA